MSTHWAAVLDEILPEPGIDLGILRDPAALELHARRAMAGAWSRLAASREDFDLVLDVLFGETLS